MTEVEIEQAIKEKTPVLIDRSWKFSSEPTIVLEFCKNKDYCKVKGSDDAYEIWRVYSQKKLEQMVTIREEGIAYVGEHIENCEAVKWVKEGQTPFEWNVVQPSLVQCNNKGQEVRDMFTYEGNDISLWYQFHCADLKCKCKKRIKSSVIGNL